MPKPTYIHKSHNVSIVLYHLVCPAFDAQVDAALREVCLEISQRYEIFFLMQSVLMQSVLMQSVLMQSVLMQSVSSYLPTAL